MKKHKINRVKDILYDIEDLVWIMHNNKAIQVKVYSIEIDVLEICYKLISSDGKYDFIEDNNKATIIFYEKELFKTKQDLLNSL